MLAANPFRISAPGLGTDSHKKVRPLRLLTFQSSRLNMADIISLANVSVSEEDDLSDEQMQELLTQAAQRLQQTTALKLSEDTKAQFKFPKLSTGEIAKSYISSKGEVAHLDSSRLLQEKDRKLSNQVRKVDDPVVLRQKTAKVRISSPTFRSLAYEEDIPNFLLERSSGTVLVAFLQK